MMGSLYSGVSGLKNHQTRMNVIGNNIANVNTIGFKTGRVTFQEAMVQTLRGASRPSAVSGGTNPAQLGLGMQVGTVDTLFLQGGLETTGQITDLAIQGQGFFVLGDNYNNRFYTRAGSFGFDANSNLVDPATGLFVMGKMADSSGEIPSLATTGPITLPFGQQDPARATEMVTLANNLDSTASSSYTNMTSPGSSNVTVVSSGPTTDGVGGTHTVSISGAQAVNSTFVGTNFGNSNDGNNFATTGALTVNMTLGDLGVDDFTNFGFSLDGGSFEPIQGLDGNTTVGEVLTEINLIDGLTAELVGGEISLTRDKAGSPVDYSFTSTPAALTLHANGGATAGNIVGVLFGLATGASLSSAGGAASTFAVTDVFSPNRGTGAAAGNVTSTLDVIIDEETGLATGFSGLGGGGVQITTGAGGLTATTPGNELVVTTGDTLHATSINVFDSQGTKHTMTIEFYKSALQNRWEWSVSTTGSESITVGQQGYVSFNPDGSLNTFGYAAGADSIVIDPGNGAEVMRCQIDAGTPGSYDGMTGFGSGIHTAALIGQDGYGMGMLEKIGIDQGGNISGMFSNGVTRVLAQIVLADFNNNGGLLKAGSSLYQPSANSGEAVEGVAGETVSGQITSGALESSSVDIAEEFTSMITTQRGFQANSKIITTSDQMLEQLVNLKR